MFDSHRTVSHPIVGAYFMCARLYQIGINPAPTSVHASLSVPQILMNGILQDGEAYLMSQSLEYFEEGGQLNVSMTILYTGDITLLRPDLLCQLLLS